MRILLVGENNALRVKAQDRLSKKVNLLLVQATSKQEMKTALLSEHFDMVLLEMGEAFPVLMAEVSGMGSPVPCLAFSDNQDYASLRFALRLGAADVINMNEDSDEMIDALLLGFQQQHGREALPTYQARQDDGLSIALHRGALLLKRLDAGESSLFFLNANRLEFLIVDVVPLEPDTDYWQHTASLEWLREFGPNGAMILPSLQHGPRLRLGATIEMNYVDKGRFRKTLEEHLGRYFSFLSGLGCVAAATSCSAEMLNSSVSRRLFGLCELVFYARKSTYYPNNFVSRACIVQESVYSEYCTAIANHQLSSALRYLDAVVAKFEQDMPSPDFACDKLLRFIWLFAAMRQQNLMSELAFQISSNHINHLHSSIVSLLSRHMSKEAQSKPQRSQMQQLIQSIEANPSMHLSIDDAANMTGFSRSHFCRLFKQQTGCSYTAFLIDQRLRMATGLLARTDLSVPNISRLVGMENIWYFRNMFRNHQGMSAEEYRACSAAH